MLVGLNGVLRPAQNGGYAVGLFNTINLELAVGVFAAAEKLRSPVIVGSAEVLLPFGPLEELSYLLLPMAKRARQKRMWLLLTPFPSEGTSAKPHR
jgi:fructose-bisphosphate aldolase class II